MDNFIGGKSLKYAIESEHGRTRLSLSGSISETAEDTLAEVLKCLDTVSLLEIHCQGIDYINSVGAGKWLAFLTKLAGRCKYEFHACSTVFVELMNLYPDFRKGGKVISFTVPYVCKTCDVELKIVYQLAAVTGPASIIEAHCPKCAGQLGLQAFADDYLAFHRDP